MRTLFLLASVILALASSPCRAQFAEEDADDNGALMPADFSWRYYIDHMNRFPERVGITCVNAYWLDKTGDHVTALRFFQECARRGNPPSMIYLSTFYEYGRGVPVDLAEAARWLRRAADTGYAVGQLHYGMALMRGRGVPRDVEAGKAWIARAAAQNDADAIAFIRSGYDPTPWPAGAVQGALP
ncbi:MAG TPA: tetratricopeptide repeat protein [Azospirillum sp.]